MAAVRAGSCNAFTCSIRSCSHEPTMEWPTPDVRRGRMRRCVFCHERRMRMFPQRFKTPWKAFFSLPLSNRWGLVLISPTFSGQILWCNDAMWAFHTMTLLMCMIPLLVLGDPECCVVIEARIWWWRDWGGHPTTQPLNHRPSSSRSSSFLSFFLNWRLYVFCAFFLFPGFTIFQQSV